MRRAVIKELKKLELDEGKAALKIEYCNSK